MAKQEGGHRKRKGAQKRSRMQQTKGGVCGGSTGRKICSCAGCALSIQWTVNRASNYQAMLVNTFEYVFGAAVNPVLGVQFSDALKSARKR